MRLVELDPSWISTGNGRRGMGVIFLCPHCRDEYVGCWFRNPLDGGPPYAEPRHDGSPEPLWAREGETFDTLTLTPSIDVSHRGHWHGFVTGGVVT